MQFIANIPCLPLALDIRYGYDIVQQKAEVSVFKHYYSTPPPPPSMNVVSSGKASDNMTNRTKYTMIVEGTITRNRSLHEVFPIPQWSYYQLVNGSLKNLVIYFPLSGTYLFAQLANGWFLFLFCFVYLFVCFFIIQRSYPMVVLSFFALYFGKFARLVSGRFINPFMYFP